MGESQMHLSQRVLKNKRNTEVTTSRAGYGGVAIDAICLGRWELDLRFAWGGMLYKHTAIHHCFATSVSQELQLAAALKIFGIWAALLFCPRPPNL